MTDPPGPGSADPPGLAVERTVLAWTRTWLTVGVVALLLLRLGSGSVLRAGASLTVGGLAMGVVTVAGRRRGRRLRALTATGPFDLAGRATLLTAATTTALGLAAALVIALP